jgi:5-methylcytosine-specific restriction endonuclease McrA
VTVSRRFLDKLEKARAALSHSHPDAGVEEILEAGLDLVLAARARRKGAARRPLERPRPSRPGHVPARVRREVWARDQGRCQWPVSGAAGGICGSTLRVEIDHVLPRARGGPSTAEGTRLLCRVHNDLAARLAFGDRWMDRYTGRGRRGRRRARAAGAPARRAPGGPPG